MSRMERIADLLARNIDTLQDELGAAKSHINMLQAENKLLRDKVIALNTLIRKHE